MLASVLHKHIDGLEEIEARAQNHIDAIIEAIDIKQLVADPHGTLNEVVAMIGQGLETDFMPMAIDDGKSLLEVIKRYDEQGKEIVIDPSKDPKENAGVVG